MTNLFANRGHGKSKTQKFYNFDDQQLDQLLVIQYYSV